MAKEKQESSPEHRAVRSSEEPAVLMPVRRLHNFTYCARLFYFQWVENLFVENADTIAGSALHANVDRPSHWREELDLAERASMRSLDLESESLGLRGVIDFVEDLGEGAEIIDYKKGSAARDPETGERVPKEYDAIQVAAYALLLSEHGVNAVRGSIYYAAERKRVEVALDEAMFAKTRRLLRQARETAESGKLPPPLRDDPRCLHCSAYSICLPNESAFWSGQEAKPAKDREPPRPPGDEGEIIVVQNNKARVGQRSGEITVSLNAKVKSKHPIEQLQAIYLYGAVQISTQAILACLGREIPIAHFSPAGRFLGLTAGLPQSGVDARLGQYRLFGEPGIRLKLTGEIIRAKIHNQRVLLMRNGEVPDKQLRQLAKLRDRTAEAESIESVRGLEGAAAAIYFEHFATMLKPGGRRSVVAEASHEESAAHPTGGGMGKNDGAPARWFDFTHRNRRPPRDPVNALLGQGYSILAKELTGVCHTVGLDPFLGLSIVGKSMPKTLCKLQGASFSMTKGASSSGMPGFVAWIRKSSTLSLGIE
ncbi:MAG: CRISPR-associated endonuclease Cas1 [Verrucomicrobiota bacterium]